jgi:hypothetical protein
MAGFFHVYPKVIFRTSLSSTQHHVAPRALRLRSSKWGAQDNWGAQEWGAQDKWGAQDNWNAQDAWNSKAPRWGSQMDPEGLGVSFIRDIARDKTCPKDSEVLSLLSCSLGRQEKHILYNLIIRKDVADARTQQSEQSLRKSCIFAQCCCFGHAHFQ